MRRDADKLPAARHPGASSVRPADIAAGGMSSVGSARHRPEGGVMVRRFGVAVIVVLALGPAAASAAAQTPVGPKQRFLGGVNGSATRAVIRMACFGPITPWQLGHPMAGQSLGVTNRPLPVASTLAVGFTGE